MDGRSAHYDDDFYSVSNEMKYEAIWSICIRYTYTFKYSGNIWATYVSDWNVL